MIDQHIQTISGMVDQMMVPNLGLIQDNKITPELQSAFQTFLPVGVHITFSDSICNL